MWVQAAQGGCGVFLAGDIPEPPGHNPMPCALGWPYLSREAGPDGPAVAPSNPTHSEVLCISQIHPRAFDNFFCQKFYTTSSSSL